MKPLLLIALILITGCSAHKRVHPPIYVVAMDADKNMKYCEIVGSTWICK